MKLNQSRGVWDFSAASREQKAFFLQRNREALLMGYTGPLISV